MSNHILPGFGRYLVTVKLPRNPDHDPRDKKTGPCPVSGQECTDVTGEHHTFLLETDQLQLALARYSHITRVERLVTVNRQVPDSSYRILFGLTGHELLLRSDLHRAALDAYSVVFEPSRKLTRDHQNAIKAAVAAALLRLAEESQRLADGEKCCDTGQGDPQCLRCGQPDEVAGWLRATALRQDPDIRTRGQETEEQGKR